ncbi:hypothetical protein M0805_008992 [Coniferiporia weirii]|nr:hypothetical protein M0805_008992 [Coniferiporia weirii]
MDPAYLEGLHSGSQDSSGPSRIRLDDAEHATYGSTSRPRLSSYSRNSANRASEPSISGPATSIRDTDHGVDELEGQTEQKDGRAKKDRPVWGKRYYPNLKLENSGSVARDHLASERTFLAYVRTSLAIASCGVALVELFSISPSSTPVRVGVNIQQFARPLGAVVIIVGILVLLIGSTRYFHVQAALIVGKFPPARHAVMFISAVLAIIVSVVFGILAGVTNI